MTFVQILKEAGPYTAPLCAAMGLAVRWFIAREKVLIEDLKTSQERERAMSEKRTQELLESTAAMGESALVMAKSLSEHDANIQEALKRCRSLPN